MAGDYPGIGKSITHLKKTGRNDPCPCGSGRKFKQCCLLRETAPASATSSHGASGERAGSNAFLGSGTGFDPASAARTVQAARAHHQAGRLQQAEILYQQVLRADPRHPDALHLMGLMAHQLGNHEKAVALIGKAIQSRGTDPGYHTNLGTAYKALNRFDEAIASWKKALALNPQFVDAMLNLGIALHDKGEVDEAVALFRKAVAISPDLAEAHNNLGAGLLSQGKPGEAQVCLRKALALNPGHFLACNNLGNALLSLGRSDEAIEYHRKAIGIRPDYAEAHYNLGAALCDFAKMDEAVTSMRTAIKLNPQFAPAHNSLGAMLLEMGRMDEARASLQTAIDLKPDYAEAHFNLHSLLLDAEDMEPSVRCLRRAVELKPADLGSRFCLGMILDSRGDSAEAAEHFELVSKGKGSDRANLDAWRHVKSACRKLPPIIGSPIQAFRIGMHAAAASGLVLEFGVRFGTSIRQIAELAKQQVHGFDSFEGLPEAWHHEPRGSYTTKGALPAVPDSVTLHQGWFEDTLPEFVKRYDGPVRFMNIDCDIYSATCTILEHLADRIVPGTVIVFDEYFGLGHEHWREDEFKAFQEAVARYGWSYEYLCFSFNTRQAVVRIN